MAIMPKMLLSAELAHHGNFTHCMAFFVQNVTYIPHATAIIVATSLSENSFENKNLALNSTTYLLGCRRKWVPSNCWYSCENAVSNKNCKSSEKLTPTTTAFFVQLAMQKCKALSMVNKKFCICSSAIVQNN